MPGDGIGKIVLDEAIRVLDAAGFTADYVHGDIGWEFWCKEGDPFPARTQKLLEEYKIGLFGAITSKPVKEAAKELAPELQNKGLSYRSPIVRMRQMFDLFVCLRPVTGYPGNPLNYKEGINMVVFHTPCASFLRGRAEGSQALKEPATKTSRARASLSLKITRFFVLFCAILNPSL